MLIGLHGILGLGAALVMPATLSTITRTFPRRATDPAVGVWAVVAGATALRVLLISGALLAACSWRAAFGVNSVLSLLAIAGSATICPPARSSHHEGVIGSPGPLQRTPLTGCDTSCLVCRP